MGNKKKINIPTDHPDYSRLIALAGHRERIREAKCTIEARNYVEPSFFRIQLAKFKQDCRRNFERAAEDIRLLTLITTLNMSGGKTQPFMEDAPPAPTTTLQYRTARAAELEKENIAFGRRLMSIQAQVGSIDIDKSKKKKKPFVVPRRFLDKCKQCNIKIPKHCKMVEYFLFPKIYFDISVRDCLSLGRVVIKLYTEAAPQVVRDIVKAVQRKEVDQMRVSHMFVDLWMEIKLPIPQDADSNDDLDIDKTMLKNMNQAGILSFSDRYIDGFNRGSINFTISVRPISVLNERRTPFGRVISNFAMLEQVQEFGTRRGNPKKRIIITDCGLVV